MLKASRKCGHWVKGRKVKKKKKELQNRAYIFLKIIKCSATYPDPVCTKLLRQESSNPVMLNISFYGCIKPQGHNLPALVIIQTLEAVKLHYWSSYCKEHRFYKDKTMLWHMQKRGAYTLYPSSVTCCHIVRKATLLGLLGILPGENNPSNFSLLRISAWNVGTGPETAIQDRHMVLLLSHSFCPQPPWCRQIRLAPIRSASCYSCRSVLLAPWGKARYNGPCLTNRTP